MSAEPSEKAAPFPTARTPRTLVALLTGGMGLSMFVLYAIGALGPFLTEDLRISGSQLGLLTAVTFGSATVLSLYAGQVTELLGGRRALTLLLVLVAAGFALLAATRTYGFLLGALVLGGAAQSLANPSTNKLIAAHVPPGRRAFAVGVKQSGVPLAAFTAGLALPTLAGALSWRAALAVVVPVALVAAAAAAMLPRDTVRPTAFRLAFPAAPNRPTRWLTAVSLCIGCCLAALNTYLPLYAHQRLSMGERSSGALIAAIGVSGIASRLLWSRLSDRLDVPRSLLILTVAAVVSAALIPAATAGAWLVWLGAVGLGCSAAAANAVSMVAVTKGSGFGTTGHASAMVSMGFFAGFVAGPLAFGLLVDATGGFTAGWALVTALFAVAGLCSWGGRQIIRDSM
ncbi:MFS transporter [Streptomyces albus]|uniref:MFS transporter n=1 Tax=Streptomyces albus TaxID=1888 RepID=UPI00131E25C1|nr:MFS transporter [Streptomyces albus]